MPWGCAVAGVGDDSEAKLDDEPDYDESVNAKTFNDWREEDRELFRSLVGDSLTSEGGPDRWTKGVFTADAFYDAYRKRQKRVRWPGRFLASIAESGEHAVDDWLLDQGLERAA